MNKACIGRRKMTDKEKIALIEEVLELEPGTLAPQINLSEISEWDSLAYLDFVVLVDEHFGTQITAAALKACKTISDLLALMK